MNSSRPPSRRADPRPGRTPMPSVDAPRPLYTAGGMAAASAAAIGLAIITTLTLIGWIAAPQAHLGEDIPDAFRVAVRGWLVGHQVGFAVPDGHVDMLPLGLLALPGVLLYRSGRWLARSCDLPRLRQTSQAALAVAGPYAAIAGTLALIARTAEIRPSLWQALLAGFFVAFLAGGAGVLRQLLVDKHIARRRMLRLIPARARSLLVGTCGATLVLLVGATVLFCAALLAGFDEATSMTGELAPGVVGGLLLFVLQVLYVPNGVIFAMSYALGPGFSLGTGTIVAPTGVTLGPLPLLPMLAALPEDGPAPALSLLALAVPFVAGAVGGALTLRSAPTVVREAAPLWGFACGVTTGLLCAAFALLAGGPLGAQRLATVGPSAWQVGIIAALEVGASAAVAAWAANWWCLRRAPGEVAAGRGSGDARGTRAWRTALLRVSSCVRLPEFRRDAPPTGGADGASADEEASELFGVTYDAAKEPDPPATSGGDTAESVTETRARETG